MKQSVDVLVLSPLFAVCKCTEACADFTKGIVESTMSGKPLDVIITEEEFSSHMLVNIEGAPLKIEALCNASACTVDPNPVMDDEFFLLEEVDKEWDISAIFSLITLSILAAICGVMSVCVFLPILTRSSDQKSTQQYTRQPTDEEENAYNGSKQVLEFRNITRIVSLRAAAAKAYGQKEKKILHNISGTIESGTLTAIMGPSGAGKSSLLNVLAAVGGSQSRISGQILLNGRQQSSGYRNKVAYVQQDDSLYETLSVRECIEYSAMLRLPKDMKLPEKRAHVCKTIQELRLTEIAQNRIGSGGRNAGVSGGERKRVSIGMELVSQPSVLVLDEPTSGLDSFAANKIVNLLSDLASKNRIVLISIHQPSMKSFMTFDQIFLLGEGRVMYNGKPSEVEEVFGQCGFPCPTMETVADHMLDVVSDKSNQEILLGRHKDDPAMQGKTVVPTEHGDDTAQDVSRESKPLLREFMILFNRTAKDIFRNRELFVMQLCISVILALFAGGIFNDVSNNLAGFQNRMGAFYFSLSFFAFSSFSAMDIFVRERHIFVREAGSKYFRAFSYFLAKTVLDMLILRVAPVSVFTFIFYWMMGLRASAEAFVIFWATLVLFNVCAGIMSICISIATPTVGQANLIAAVWFLIMLLFGGFLVNVDSMEPWYAWLKFASIFYYSFEILTTNELSGLLLSFDAPGYPELPVYGEVFLATIGMNANNQLRDLICLCSLAIGLMMVAYLLLLLRVPPSAGRQFQNMERENKRLK